MNTKATSLTSVTAIVAAAAVAIAPVSGAVAATSSPAATPAAAVASSIATPAAVLKNIAAAPAAANAAATGPAALGTFVVVTDEAVQGAAAAASSATSQAAAIELPTVPKSVTDLLNLAGLPVQAVYRVLQTSQGVYTIWYKMLTSVPQAIFKGEFGSVPGLFQKAVTDSLTWIATGAGPKAAEAPKAATATASETAVKPNPITAGLDVLGIPVATAYAGGQAALSIYKSFYGLLTSVPQAIFQGKFGDAVNLVVDAVSKSVTTIVEFPGAQIKAASDKIDKLIASLTPGVAAPTVTSTDAVSRTSGAAADETLVSSVADKAAVVQKPATEAAKPSGVETSKPAVAETSKPAAEPTVTTPAAEPTVTKPAAEPTVTKPVESTPTETKPVVEESKPTVDSKPAAESKPTTDAKPAAESKPTTDSKPAAESKPTSDSSASGSSASEGASASDSSAGSTTE